MAAKQLDSMELLKPEDPESMAILSRGGGLAPDLSIPLIL